MESPNHLFYYRSIERCIILSIAAFTIFLGFYLFLAIPDISETEGEIEIFKAMAISWSNTGPGIYFVALGSFILFTAFKRNLNVKIETDNSFTTTVESPETTVETTSMNSSKVIANYLGSKHSIADEQAQVGERDKLKLDIDYLNTLQEFAGNSQGLSKLASEKALQNFLISVPRIKARLMFSVWNEDWGDYATFLQWIDDGEPDQYDESINSAVLYFQYNRG